MSLPTLVERAVTRATAAGALVSFETVAQLMIDVHTGMKFIISKSTQPLKKPTAADVEKEQKKHEWKNPFLPHEEALFVGSLTETYKVILNKYNVVKGHLILTTKEFIPQLNMLDLTDFEAAEQALKELDGIVYFNYGPHSGMSQPHRHLQLIPALSDDQSMPQRPIEEFTDKCNGHSLPLPFRHAFAKKIFPSSAVEAFKLFSELMERLGNPESYNLLLSREWLLVVPRVMEKYEGLGVNALGFIGGILVKTDEDYERLLEITPMEVLSRVTGVVCDS